MHIEQTKKKQQKPRSIQFWIFSIPMYAYKMRKNCIALKGMCFEPKPMFRHIKNWIIWMEKSIELRMVVEGERG